MRAPLLALASVALRAAAGADGSLASSAQAAASAHDSSLQAAAADAHHHDSSLGVSSFPPDWAARIASGNMVATTDLPLSAGGGLMPGFAPVVGNGFIGREVMMDVQDWVDSWPWRDSGAIHVPGLNNGLSFAGPSHKAQIPPLSVEIVGGAGTVNAVAVGTAVDFEFGTVYNRTLVVSSATTSSSPLPSSCSNTLIEKRMYAHRVRRHVLVTDLTATQADAGLPWAGCTLQVAWNTTASSVDLLLNPTMPCEGGAGCLLWSGTNRVAEEAGAPLTRFAMAWDAWVNDLPVAPGANDGNLTRLLTFAESGQTLSLRIVFSLDFGGDVPAGSTPEAEASNEWASLSSVSPQDLWQEHADAWSLMTARGGIELAGNTSFGGILNSSLMDILSSLRPDWHMSTSPGGIGTGAYCGHTFWDMETWMMPLLMALHPDLAWSAAQYRIDRLGASMQRAQNFGYEGAFWSWESGVTGLDTSPWRLGDTNEQHISADIPLAWRRLYYATGNQTFLRQAWPALSATCAFWACRFQRVDSVGPGPANSNCSAKDGAGNFTVHNVVCPDESSSLVNDSAYTNAAAAETLSFCGVAAGVLGEQVPPLWAEIAASPYLPLVSGLSPDGPVHNEYSNFTNRTINQADVALLQYPLGLQFPADLARRDLDYWASVTDFTGMFTGDASYAAAYLALGDRSAADAQVGLVWPHLEEHFYAFKETSDPARTQHFITGSGGLLQTFVFGYPGLRIERLGVFSFSSQQPVLPPLGVTGVKLRGLGLFGTEFDVFYNSTAVCAALNGAGGALPPQPGAAVLELRVPPSSTNPAPPPPMPLPLTGLAVCVPVGPVEVAVTGMP